MKMKASIRDSISEQDREILHSTMRILNNILLRNNLAMRAVVLFDDDNTVAIDSKDDYDDLAAGRAFVHVVRE